ncbi:MAG: ubiquitin-like small modifier protein 1 [Acidimicrobiales bacterium]
MPATVGVRVPASLRAYAGGSAVLDVEIGAEGDEATVRGVLDRLLVSHPDLERRVRTEQGDLRPHVNLFVGSENIRDLGGLATPVGDGAGLTILPAVSGGDLAR